MHVIQDFVPDDYKGGGWIDCEVARRIMNGRMVQGSGSSKHDMELDECCGDICEALMGLCELAFRENFPARQWLWSPDTAVVQLLGNFWSVLVEVWEKHDILAI